jgi:hypothetical protein
VKLVVEGVIGAVVALMVLIGCGRCRWMIVIILWGWRFRIGGAN